MNAQSLFLTALITFSATNTLLPECAIKQQKVEQITVQPQQQGFKEIYGGGIIPGAIIGYITGKISAYGLAFSMVPMAINPESPVFVGTTVIALVAVLVTENIVRKKIVNDVNENLEGRYIENKKRQMETSARIASWVGLLF